MSNQTQEAEPMNQNSGPQEHEIGNVHTEQAQTQPAVDPHRNRKDEPSRLLGISGYQSPYSGARTYNYEEKYVPDPLGQEMKENARVWKTYLDEAENYDDEMLRGFKDTIDSLLVFAALFSAVVTSFVVSTVSALQPDYNQITAVLLFEQVQLLRAAGNITAINATPSSNVTQTTLSSTSPGSNDLWINGLFFASLSLSLSTALLSVLIKQWLQAYSSISSGNAKERALIRQFRFAGLEKWKVPEIIGILPLILHTSLALFFAGLSLYVAELYEPLTWVVVIITVLAFTMYLGSIFLPAVWLQCPYRIPLLFVPVKYILYSFSIVGWMCKSLLHQLSCRATYQIVDSRDSNQSLSPLVLSITPDSRENLSPFVSWQALHFKFTTLVKHIITTVKQTPRPEVSICSLKESELQFFKSDNAHHTIQADVLAWLCTLESNVSIQRIVAQSINGLFKNQDILDIRDLIYKSKLHKYLDSLAETMWNSLANLNDNDTYGSQIWPMVVSEWIQTSSWPQMDIKIIKRACIRAVKENRKIAVKKLAQISQEVQYSGLKSMAWKWFSSALYEASENGHFHTVKILTESGGANVNVNPRKSKYGTALQAAACKGHWNIVKCLVDHGADINKQGVQYRTALQAAIQHGQLEIVKYLVEKGAGVNAQGGEFGTALQAAAYYGESHIVRYLVDQGAYVNASQGSQGEYGPAIQVAAWRNEWEIVKYLAENSADVNLKGKHGTALQAAIWNCKWDIVKYLVDKGADVNSYQAALHIAAWNGKWDLVIYLVDKGANVNAQGYPTALQAAVWSCQWDKVMYLVDNGANVNEWERRYGTTLQEVAWYAPLELVKYLVEKGVDVNAHKGIYGTTALQTVATRSLSLVKFLVDHGAYVNAPGGEHGTALQAAAWYGHLDIVMYLVDKGADINLHGEKYGTALQAGASQGLEIVKYLVDNGADVNAKGGVYGSALQAAAAQLGHLDIVKCLVDKGADVNAIGGKYGTALQAAAWRGSLDIIQYLVDKGADVNAQGGKYGSALQAAAAEALEDRLNLVQYLVDKGADVNAQAGGEYGTALQAARRWHNSSVIKYLMNKGAAENARDKEHASGLEAAPNNDNDRTIHFLSEHGKENALGLNF